MSDEIKEILDKFKIVIRNDLDYMLRTHNCKILLDYITNLQQENEYLKEQNNDLRKIYRNTYQKLFANGNDELANYFMAQIDDCPTFYVEPIIDYAREWKDYKSRCEKASDNCKKSIEAINEKLKNNKEPFEVVDGNIIYLNDYQVARLKAIRMKCKELLNILQNGSDSQ